MKLSRLCCVFFLIVGVGHVAHAQFVINVITSTYAFSPSGSGNVPWSISNPPLNNVVNFNPGAIPVTVGNATTNTSATVNIIYSGDGTNAYPLSTMGLVFTGLVVDKGRIFWTEIVEDILGNVILNVSGSRLGSAYAGGSDGAFTFDAQYSVQPALDRFIVKKTFFLDIGNATLPSNSIASLGTIQQVLLPEPSTWVAMGLGALLIGARLRKRLR